MFGLIELYNMQWKYVSWLIAQLYSYLPWAATTSSNRPEYSRVRIFLLQSRSSSSNRILTMRSCGFKRLKPICSSRRELYTTFVAHRATRLWYIAYYIVNCTHNRIYRDFYLYWLGHIVISSIFEITKQCLVVCCAWALLLFTF